MQVQVYCSPLNGKEMNSEVLDRMTRPARNVADDQPESHPPAKKADPQPAPAPAPPPPPAAKPTSDEDWGKKARDKSNSNFSLVNDNAASSAKPAVGFIEAAVALSIAALIPGGSLF
ncbi:hypothetical protein GGF43_003156 [Coemansia sp. RSA 2618]|nr:hypothetical protein GGF43_003156 [Coemansia sp. RSA 2618]